MSITWAIPLAVPWSYINHRVANGAEAMRLSRYKQPFSGVKDYIILGGTVIENTVSSCYIPDANVQRVSDPFYFAYHSGLETFSFKRHTAIYTHREASQKLIGGSIPANLESTETCGFSIDTVASTWRRSNIEHRRRINLVPQERSWDDAHHHT